MPDAETSGPPPYPLVVAVYGGPNTQIVRNTWALTADARAQRMRASGVVTLKLDNRGSANRGKKFEGFVRTKSSDSSGAGATLGDVEVLDQVSGVSFLIEKGWVDPNCVGVSGWSYGGFLAVNCLLRRPDVFAVAVAGAPVTDWSKYVTHYSERYLGVLSPETQGRYNASSLVKRVEGMPQLDKQDRLGTQKRLLLVHGASDENVHLRHTKALCQALDQHDVIRGRDDLGSGSGHTGGGSNPDGSAQTDTRSGEKMSYELLVIAGERHVPRGRIARRALERHVSSFLHNALCFASGSCAFFYVFFCHCVGK